MVLWDTVKWKVSFKKLLNTEESMLCVIPKKALAIKNNISCLFLKMLISPYYAKLLL